MLASRVLLGLESVFPALSIIIPFKSPSLEKQQIPFSLPSFNSVCLENILPSEEKISFFRVWFVLTSCQKLSLLANALGLFRTILMWGDGVVPISIEDDQGISCQKCQSEH